MLLLLLLLGGNSPRHETSDGELCSPNGYFVNHHKAQPRRTSYISTSSASIGYFSRAELTVAVYSEIIN